MMETLRQDVRLALRGLRTSPGFAAAALLTLALGIGANTAVFSVVSGVLLRPLPYPDAGRILTLWQDTRSRGRAAPEWLTPPDFIDWRDQNRAFEHVAAFQDWGPNLTGDGEPELLPGSAVTADYLRVLGVVPPLGRDFTPQDDSPGGDNVVLLTHGLWLRRFGGDPSIVGRTLTLDGMPWTVIGVLPKSFRPVVPGAEILRPRRLGAGDSCGRGCFVLRVVGRLKPGVTLSEAAADLGAIAARNAQAYPETNRGIGAWLIPLREWLVGDLKGPILAMWGAVGFVLLIACANLASLFLIRGNARHREITVRYALGAERSRLVRQLLTETLVFALLGGLAGLLLAVWGTGLLGRLLPAGLAVSGPIAVDRWAVLFTMATAVASGLLFGLFPAWRASTPNLAPLLNAAARSLGSQHSPRLRSGLIVAELALALVLLTGAGLLLRSFMALQRVDLGFRPERTLAADILLPAGRYAEPERIVRFYDGLLDGLRSHSEVEAVAATSVVPLTIGDNDVTIQIGGRTLAAGEQPPAVWYRQVTTDYFRVLGIPLLSGRAFTAQDRLGSPYVGIVNATAAKRYWPGENPVGQSIGLGQSTTTIVGVVGDVHHDGAGQAPKAELYLPQSQRPSRAMTLLLRGRSAPGDLAPLLRTEVRSLDADQPVGQVYTLETLQADSVRAPRLFMLVFGVFAAVALGLAAMGIYGVMAYAVAQRTREFGLRMALGANPRDVRAMVLAQGARLALYGMTLGLALALGLSGVFRSFLYEVSPTDPWTFAGVPLVLGGVLLLACYVPARRATRLDPMAALRTE